MNLAGNACALSLCALLSGWIPAGAEAALSIDAPASAARGTRAMNGSLFGSGTQGLIAADLIGDNAPPGVFALGFEATLDDQAMPVVVRSVTVTPACEISALVGAWLFGTAALALLASRWLAAALDPSLRRARSVG